VAKKKKYAAIDFFALEASFSSFTPPESVPLDRASLSSQIDQNYTEWPLLCFENDEEVSTELHFEGSSSREISIPQGAS
jgi:hypothetical protein